MLFNAALSGAIATAAMVAALFFLRFWHTTRDRFFLFFAVSFGLESLSRFLIGVLRGTGDETPAFYLLRLAAYALILIAIVDKNRRTRPPK